MRGVRRSLVAAVSAVSSAWPLCVFVFVCGVGLLPAPRDWFTPDPPETCRDKLRRCVIEDGRPVADCAREFFACLGPWGGPLP